MPRYRADGTVARRGSGCLMDAVGVHEPGVAAGLAMRFDMDRQAAGRPSRKKGRRCRRPAGT